MASEDDYERKFMTEGTVLYREKVRAPKYFSALLFLPAILSVLILGAVTLSGAAPAATMLAAIPSLLISFPLWALFSVLRASVSTTHVHIQYGLFGPKIPIADILSCEAFTYDWKQYGGFGIRRGRDGSWMYNMMGDEGHAVAIRWRDEHGKEVKTLVSAPDPEGLVRAVAQARAGTKVPKVRVGKAPDPELLAAAEREVAASLEADADGEAEAEAEAEAAAAAKRVEPR